MVCATSPPTPTGHFVLSYCTPTVWLILIGLLYINGAVFFFFIPFDRKLDHRNVNYLHATLLIAIPAMLGVAPRFFTKHWPLRLFYLVVLWFGISFFGIFLNNALMFATVRFRMHQVNTIGEMVDGGFSFTGSASILDHMQKQQNLVRFHCFTAVECRVESVCC